MYINSSTNYNINISSNADALRLRELLANSSDKLSQSMQRMSSGSKINSAKDDAAGVVISARMLIQLQGNQICQNNLQSASAMLSTTSDSLDDVLNNFSRIRDLTLQAKNGTYSDKEIEIMQDEVDQRIAEIDRLSDNAKYSELNLFGGDLASNGISFQVGADATEDNTITIDSSIGVFNSVKFDDLMKYIEKDLSSKVVDENGIEQSVEGIKADVAAFNEADNAKIYYLETGDNKEGYELMTKNYENYEAAALNLYQFKGEIDNKEALDEIQDAKVGDIYTVANIAYEYKWNNDENGFVWEELAPAVAEKVVPNNIVINPYDEQSEDKKFNLLDIKYDDESYETAMNALDNAIDDITNRKASIGAIQNRLTSAYNTLTTQFANMSSAKSIITDADIATEAANFTQNQILQQVSTSLLAQANQAPAIAFSLI